MRHPARNLAWIVAVALAAAGCGGTDDGDGGGDARDVADARDAADAADAADVPAADPGAEVPDVAVDPVDVVVTGPDVVVGTFIVSLVEAVPATAGSEASDAYSQVLGKVYDGPTPDLVQWNETLVDGDCRVLIPYVPFCGEGCGSGACVADDACQAYPVARGAGRVTVRGVRDAGGQTQFTLDPVAKAYQTVEPMPFPPFAEGDAVSVSAAGDELAAFTVSSTGIAPLALSGDALALARDTDLPLAWTAAGASGNTRIRVKLDISHHAGSKGKIECDTADDGNLVIAGALVTKLLDLGVAGFPTIVVARHAVGSTQLTVGRVELDVVSDLEASVGVPGVVSCNEDGDCPDGQHCQTSLMCQ